MKNNFYVVVLIALTSCNQFKSNNAIVDKANHISYLWRKKIKSIAMKVRFYILTFMLISCIWAASAKAIPILDRTNGTDAFDTLYIGCEKFPYRDAFSINVSGVIWYQYLLGDAEEWFCPRNRCAPGSSWRTFEKIIAPPGYCERSHGLRHTASIPIAKNRHL